MKETESNIQATICEYLAARHHFFWRQNTAPTWDKDKATFRAMPKHAMRGVPDIIVIKDGRLRNDHVGTRTEALRVWPPSILPRRNHL